MEQLLANRTLHCKHIKTTNNGENPQAQGIARVLNAVISTNEIMNAPVMLPKIEFTK